MNKGRKISHGCAETAYKADDFCLYRMHQLFCGNVAEYTKGDVENRNIHKELLP